MTVIWHVTMSLDGFIAGPNHEIEWVSLNWLPRHNERPPPAQDVIDTTGAILAGRRWYDVVPELGGVEGIYDGHWTGPVLVLTHRPEPPAEHPRVTFVTGGIEHAVAAAREAAQGRNVVIFGADLTNQALEAGLVDEILVHVAPVLLGDGIRLHSKQVRLEPITLGSTGHQADLRYRVVRD